MVVIEGISVKVCWDPSDYQDSKTELMKGAYCTLLDIPHKSKIPEFGKIFILVCFGKQKILFYSKFKKNIYTSLF